MTFVEEAGIWFGELFSLLFPTGRLLRWFSLGLVEVVFDEFVIFDDFDEGIWGGGVVIRHTKWTVNASLTSLASSKRRTSFKMAVFSNNFPAYTNLKINQMTKCKLLSHQKVIIRRAEIDTNEIANGKNNIILHFKASMFKNSSKLNLLKCQTYSLSIHLHTLKQDMFFISNLRVLTHQNWSKQQISTTFFNFNSQISKLNSFSIRRT